MLIVSMLAFFVVIFFLATITVAIAWMAFAKKAAESNEASRDLAESENPEAAVGAAEVWDEDSPLFRHDRLSSLGFWDNLLARFDIIEILKNRIAQADMDWSVGRVTLLMLLSGTVAFLAVMRVLPAVALLAGAAAAFLPYAYILRRRSRRFRKFREAFPDVLDSMARALRAGYPLAAAMDMVASEAAAPVAAELKKTSAEANLGMGWPRALENLGQRVPLLEVNLFGAAVVLHSRTGGRLSEVITAVAENMREAQALQGEIRALAAHGKLTGIILTVLPAGIAAIMMVVSPGYMQILYNHPLGGPLIFAAIACLVLAHFVIRKLVDIKV
jgi:tight adherence protein B